MKRKILLSTLILLGCLLTSTTFSQTVQEKTLFYGKTITGINVSNTFTVKVLLGSKNYLKLEYDPIYEDYIDATLVDGILKLQLKKNNIVTKSKTVLNAVVCVTDLTEVTASGAVDVYFIGNYTPKNIKIKASASSDIYGLNCKTNDYELVVSASSDVKDFVVEAKNAIIKAGASSDIKNIDIKSENAKISASSSSDIYNINLNISNHLELETGASSDIKEIKINSKNADIKVNSSSDFINSNITIIDKLTINIGGSSGISNAIISCNNSEIVVSGSSDFLKSTINCKDLSLTTSASSTTSLIGKAENAKINVGGSGTVKMKDFEIKNLIVALTGSSTGYFTVKETLSYSSNASSDLYIYGNPLIKQGEGKDIKFIK